MPGGQRRSRPGDTLAGVLDRYPESGHRGLRAPRGEPVLERAGHATPHRTEAAAICDTVGRVAGDVPRRHREAHGVRRRRVLPDGRRPFPAGRHLRGVPPARERPRHGPGLRGRVRRRRGPPSGVRPGFFASVDGAPAAGYRAPRIDSGDVRRDTGSARSAILTGEYGARVLGPLVASLPRHDIRVVPVVNDFFGGNIGVAGLLTGPISPGARATSRRGTATSCPTRACRRAASSTT